MYIRRQLLGVLIVTAAIWLVFGVSIRFGIVDLDDHEHILANPAVLNPSWLGVLSVWKESYFKLYIPMTYMGWAGISALASELSRALNWHPFAIFHLANVLCHTVTSLMVLAIFRLKNQSYVASFFGALFFALHPLQVEAVAWISGFKDTFSGMFSVLAVYFLIKCSESNRFRDFVWSTAFCFAAIFAKPTSVIVPLLAFVLIPRDPNKGYSRNLVFILGVQLILGLVAVIHAMSIQPASDLPFDIKIWQRPFIAADALLFYAVKIIAPFKLGFDYGMDPLWVLKHRPTGLALGVVGGFALLITLYPRCRRLRSPAGLFFIGLLPTLGLVSYYYQAISTTADRYVYLAMLGPAYLLALTVTAFQSRAWFRSFRGVCVFLIVGYGVLSFKQVQKWQSTNLIAQHTLEVNQRSWLAHHILGGALIKSGDLTDGVAHLRQTIAMRPWFPDAYYNLGVAAKMTGDLEGAVTNFKSTVRYEPKDSRAWYELATSLATLGRYDQASDAFERSLAIPPTSGEVLGEYGRLKVSQGDLTAGVMLLEKAVVHGSNSPLIYATWGEGLLRLGKDRESLAHFTKALESGYRDATLLANYGLVNMRLGYLDEAIRALEEGVALDPQGVIACYNLGLAYEKKGDREKAHLLLKKALALRPDFTPAQKALERVGSL